MNSSIILLIVVIAMLASRKRKLVPVSSRQYLVWFAAILAMHVAVIGVLMAVNHIRHL